MINIGDFGAVGDGITLDTAAVQKALDCCKKNGGTVVVPGGKTYKIGTIQIYSNTELYLESGAVLKQSDRIEDLRSISIVDKSNNETDIPSYINCEYNGKPAHYFIYATGENIRIQDTAPLMEMNPFITALKPDITLRVHGIPERRFFI